MTPAEKGRASPGRRLRNVKAWLFDSLSIWAKMKTCVTLRIPKDTVTVALTVTDAHLLTMKPFWTAAPLQKPE